MIDALSSQKEFKILEGCTVISSSWHKLHTKEAQITVRYSHILFVLYDAPNLRRHGLQKLLHLVHLQLDRVMGQDLAVLSTRLVHLL